MERLTITMPSEMADVLRASVEGGEYASASEIVREALRDWSRARQHGNMDVEAIRSFVRRGDESGPGVPAGQVFSEIRQMLQDRHAERR